MFARKLIVRRHFLWTLSLVALLFQFAGSLPAAAAAGAYVFDTQATVSVSNLTLHSPNPCYRDVQFSGDLLIQAHIVYPPEPVVPTGTIVTLHLDATGIRSVGLSDDTFYRGTQGTSQTFFYTTSPMAFDAVFDIVPSQPNQFPPNPCSPAQLRFEVQLLYAGEGAYSLSVSLMPIQ